MTTTSIGSKLKLARKQAGLSQKEAAEEIGSKPNSIWRYQDDRHMPSAITLRGLVLIYGKRMDWFFEETQK